MSDYTYTTEEIKAISTKDREDLKPYEVEVDEIYKTGKLRRLSPKNCFSKAFEYMASKEDIEELRLVHGLYKPKSVNNYSAHAWVELPNGIVFDGVMQRFYDKDSYYKHYEVKNCIKYTNSQMYDEGMKAGGHYGPWSNNLHNAADSHQKTYN